MRSLGKNVGEDVGGRWIYIVGENWGKSGCRLGRVWTKIFGPRNTLPYGT